MRLGRDGATGLVGLAVSLFLLPKAFGLPQLPIVPIGPGFYPTLVLVFMAITSAILVIQDLSTQRRPAAPDVGADAGIEGRRAYDLVASAFAIVGAYVVLLPLVGFRLSTVLFVAAFQLMLERPVTVRQWGVLATVAIATSLLTYLIFERYLLVLLPRGAWTGW